MFTIRGDTTVENQSYKKMYRRSYEPEDAGNVWNALPPYPVSNRLVLFALVRDDVAAETVYGRYVNSTLATDYPGEVVIHDFSGGTGENMTAETWCNPEQVSRVEWTIRFGALRKHQYIDIDEVFVSGVGKIRGRKAGVFSLGQGCGGNEGGEIIEYCIGSDEACGFVRPNSVQNFSDSHQITVFPNPADDDLNIISSNPFGTDVKISLTDIAGRVLQTENFRQQIRLSIPDLTSGVYLLTFTMGERQVVRKFVKR